jgi:hypothetical protein
MTNKHTRTHTHRDPERCFSCTRFKCTYVTMNVYEQCRATFTSVSQPRFPSRPSELALRWHASLRFCESRTHAHLFRRKNRRNVFVLLTKRLGDRGKKTNPATHWPARDLDRPTSVVYVAHCSPEAFAHFENDAHVLRSAVLQRPAARRTGGKKGGGEIKIKTK